MELAAKKKHVDRAAESPAKSKGETSADFAKPIYLVVEQKNGDEQSAAYSVIKVDAAVAVADNERPPRARIVAVLGDTKHGMSFVAVHSEHGSWIVGIGGRQELGTIIFDPSTFEPIRGPGIVFPRDEPILISHSGVVYALSRRPRVEPYLDFEPWFQSLSFNHGVPSLQSISASWSFLTPPPFFPCSLDPYEFDNPPEIMVTSYVATGSHILLSPQPQLNVGTHGFHVVKKTWEKVCDDNLPFVGQQWRIYHRGGWGSSPT